MLIETTPAAPAEDRTRDRVARSLRDHGASTVASLAERLDLTAAAVRRHLDGLLEAGLVEARQARSYGSRGRGRPPRVFALTDAGRDQFEHTYDDLATDALRFLADTAGDEAVLEFARARVAELEARYAARFAATPPADRPRLLAEVLRTGGYAAAVGGAPRGGGEQLFQHHCPVAHVAKQFPQLCEAETEMFSRLLGTHVQRLATIAHGDGVCTTNIPSSTPHDPTHPSTTHPSTTHPTRGGAHR
ncbi:MAG TPA: helix-turn-helix domain-containing protein [Actinomycetes bacterium]|nr:helix-turn-helix domain-containing protein [Actinomycetes bacterium]